MTLHFENESDAVFDFSCEEQGKMLLEYVMDYMECPYEAEASLLLTTDEEIHQINKEQRNIDRATDVLSFPMSMYQKAGEFDWLEEAWDSFEPDSGELMLGDIVISTDHVKAQALEYGHSELREFSFLVVHSLLHLIGYDHIEEDDRIIMEKLQGEILESLGITR